MSTPNSQAPLAQTVLLVDDTPNILRLLSEHLESEGLRVSVASDGEEAVRRAELLKPDIILMDVMMPVLDGLEALKKLMLNPDTADIPTILMTSFHGSAHKLEGFRNGAVDYITKPLQLEEVSARIRTHLALRDLRRRIEAKNIRLEAEIADKLRAEEALRQSHELLEQRVASRTALLADTNRRLSEEIEQRNRAESHLRQSQKMEIFGQLASGVAHDFNNILTIILGQAQCVDFPDTTAEEQTEALREISLAARRASNLTRQMLMFSRRQNINRVPIAPDLVISDLSKMLRRMIGEDIELLLELGAANAAILGDTAMLEQVLMNIAVNARDAMPRGGVLSISTNRVRRTPPSNGAEAKEMDYFCISLRDTGHGIQPEQIPLIFEPFFTTKKPGQGTGLGLAICQSIIRQHEGWIEVDSVPGTGTRFLVFLPLAEAGIPVKESTILPQPSGLKGGCVLLVEDEEGVRRSSSRMLARAGYSVLEAGDAAEALTIWNRESERIDLVLTDVIMPGMMSGHDLARALLLKRPGLRVLFMSGYDPSLLASRSPGQVLPQHYLPKPFCYADLIRAVNSAIRKD